MTTLRTIRELIGPLTSSLAIVCAYAGRGPEAIEWARRALSEPTPSPTVAVTARQGLALGLALCGRDRDAVEALAAPAISPTQPARYEVELVITRGAIKAQAGDLRGAVADLTAVIEWSRAGIAPRGLPNAYASLAEAEYRLGRWQRGAAHAELAVSLARDSDQIWELPFAHAAASLFDAGRGEWPAAEQHVEAAASAAQLAPLPLAVFYARVAAANLAVARGESGRALELLDGALGRAARGRRSGVPAPDLRARGRRRAAGWTTRSGGRAARSVRGGLGWLVAAERRARARARGAGGGA